MRAIEHPVVADAARDWVRGTLAAADEAARAAERAKNRGDTPRLVRDLTSFAVLLHACADWMVKRVPSAPLPAGRKLSAEERVLQRLGALDAAAIALKTLKERHISRVIDACERNMDLASRLLGVHRRTVEKFRLAQITARRR